ncbi:tonB-dependent receptor family protein [Asticcacaulis biprosthecium C19]|uniref:TonB-dependent receptor family protein n=1 Tax=Asticcacaulis biprosthecium C19 TaxID=715226 RepID=F4QJY1_9CAUL|nr:TonB-dependent receptor [Asticcacaulis biprosthecium]EGF93238.1 tonB-dependent receptor family protein [Asticcacaulis biprosthecium C19]
MKKASVRLLNGQLLLAGTTLLMVSAMPAFAQSQVKTFNVAAQPAQQGITQFAEQADLQLVAPERVVAGQKTAAVQGTMPVKEGLSRLLAGTNLTPVTQSNGVVVLAAAQAAPQARYIPTSAVVAAEPSASQAAPEPAPEVVVKGIRGSLNKARDIKRRSANTVESIVAEDIGKMPDLNLAESIQRVPGVAMSREGGEGRNITLRGFGPDFTRTTLNGMEVPASSDGLDTGGVTINAGRAFDFHLFASELFNRIDIEKTQKASTEEGGIAGTVGLYSARPFDFREDFTVSASAQGNYNSLTEKADPRFAVLVSKKFMDGKLGALVSAAMSNRTVHQEGYSSVRWTSPFANGDSWADSNPTVSGTPKACGAADPLDCLWAPRLPRADFFGNDQKRVGLTGSLQYKPNEDLVITFDALHSELTNDRYSYNSMEWLLTHGTAGNYTGQTPVSFKIAPDGKTLVAASFNDVTSWYESRHQESTSTFDQFVLSGKWRVSDRLSFEGLIGQATDDADRTELRFYYRSVPHAYAYDYSDNAYIPKISFGSYDPNLASNYVNALTAANRINNVKKENFSTKFDGTYNGDGFYIKAGVNYNDRTVQYSEGYGASPSFNPSTYTMPFPIDNFGSGLDGDLVKFRVADFDAIAAAGVITPGYTNNAGAGWTVGEETMGGYVELNGEYDLAGMRLRTNTGLRYVKTNVRSIALIAGTRVEDKVSYQNYLPSINLALDVRPDLVLRAAYGRSMTRPGLSTLNIAGPVFGYTTRTVGNVGNPELKPYESNDVDLSLEWYFGKEGLLSVSVFNKDIVRSLKTDVVTKMIDPSFWPAIYADPQYDESYNADPAEVPYTFTIPVNSDEGNSVKGFEVTYNQPFTFLPGPWSNLGVASNYTHVSAEDSTGLSPNSYNLTVYYDTEQLGARISVNKRDDYLISQPGGNGHVQERKYGPTHVDFASFYKLSDNLTLTFEGINITDEVERIYGTGDTGDMDLTREYTHTGSQWILGVRYRY